MSSTCILVAEDDPGTRYLVARTLRGEGYFVLEAEDGDAALRIVELHPIALDLLITDVHMPLLSGHELTRLVRPVRPEMPILIVSRDRHPELQLDAIQPTMFLTKPFQRSVFLSTVKKML
jgi:two-component system, cell cycle sensor histidine kinase and response regulator CckA